MAKTTTRRRPDYAGTNMWVIPSLREARQNLPGRAEERKVLTALIMKLARKDHAAESVAAA